MNRSTIKSTAKRHLQGNVLNLTKVVLLPSIIIGILFNIPYYSMISRIQSGDSFAFFTLPAFVVAVVSQYVNTSIMLNLLDWYRSKDNKHLTLSAFVDEYLFNPSKILEAFKSDMWTLLFVTLWSLIPFVGWIVSLVKLYGYYFAQFIKYDTTDITARQSLSESTERMVGRKMDLFILHLSFIGWWLVVALTLGLASVYVVPYQLLCDVVVYEKVVKGN